MKFKIVKVKTGLDPEEDAARILKIHEAFPDLVVRVDANQGYNVKDLGIFLDRTKEVTLDLIEQPFPVDTFIEDIEWMEEKDAAILVADESMKDPTDALEIIRRTKQCRIFNIKLMKTGGLLAARQIAHMAETASMDLMWGCNDESAVSIAAALHLALSCPHTKYLDLDGSLDLVEDAVSGGFSIGEGLMMPSLAGGLGVEIRK